MTSLMNIHLMSHHRGSTQTIPRYSPEIHIVEGVNKPMNQNLVPTVLSLPAHRNLPLATLLLLHRHHHQQAIPVMGIREGMLTEVAHQVIMVVWVMHRKDLPTPSLFHLTNTSIELTMTLLGMILVVSIASLIQRLSLVMITLAGPNQKVSLMIM
jgi:hypothetical protein